MSLHKAKIAFLGAVALGKAIGVFLAVVSVKSKVKYPLSHTLYEEYELPLNENGKGIVFAPDNTSLVPLSKIIDVEAVA
jgi:hypothetical protein